MERTISKRTISKRTISKTAVDRAGDVLRESASNDELREAMRLVSAWRDLHFAPLAALNALLRRVLVREGRWEAALVARRLKRMESIVRKLRRFPAMKASRMQDMGGVRVILDSVEDVHAFHERLLAARDKCGLEPESPPVDYIAQPKPDGYRSLHQVFRHDGGRNPHLAGLRVELQIRTHLQHAWATAVETLGFLERTSFKTGEGDTSFRRYFSLGSALFSIHEKQPLPEDCRGISASRLVGEFEDEDAKLRVRTRLAAPGVFEEPLPGARGKKEDPRLLVLRANETGQGVVLSQNINAPEMAFMLYSAMEQKYKDDPGTTVLLLQIDDMRELRQAYPNYYLDASLFLENISTICDRYR